MATGKFIIDLPEITTAPSDADLEIQTKDSPLLTNRITKENLQKELKAGLDDHVGDTDNPHDTTYDNIGGTKPEYTHAETTGQTPDDHHNRAHDHTDPLDGTVAHASTTGQTTDDHHAKAHAHDNLDGSGTVAHANTTGKTTDDHHPISHTHDGLDGSGSVSHDDLNDVSIDDHHNKAHSHDGVDGSGTVAHSDTTGQGTDDHHKEVHTHDGTPAEGGSIAHAVTTGQTVDDHHKQVHTHDGTPAEGGSIAHSVTTGQTTDDHHPKLHSADHSLGGVDVIDHDDLAGLTPDNHHSELHDHNGDGSGDIQHASTKGQTPDDHHNQVHLLYGADHSDIDISSGLVDRNILAKRVTDGQFQPEFRINWLGSYIAQTYYKHDMVNDAGYLMVANKETTDRAAPQDIGQPVYGIDPAIPFNQLSDQSIVGVGHVYTMTKNGYINGLFVQAPSWSLDAVTKVSILTPSGAAVINNPLLTAGEWTTLALTKTPMLIGSQIIVAFEFYYASASNQISGGWDSNISAAAIPANQEFNASQVLVGSGVLAIDHTDLDTVDHTLELRGVVVGSIGRLVETGDTARSTTILITSIDTTQTEVYSTYTYDVTDIGSNGAIRTNRTTTVTIDVPITVNTDYSIIPNHYAVTPCPFATLATALQFDGVDQGADPDNAYGINLLFQEAFISPDWDFASSTGGGGGGGGDFVPDLFTGAGSSGYVPDPVTETGKHLKDDGTWELPPVVPPQTFLHDDLTDVSADQHHAEIHDYSSHTGLPTIPPPQTYLHEDLTDVTSDQHHPQSHAHDGVDGSGTVDYDDLTNKPTIPAPQTYLHNDLTDVSVDQHHKQVHTHDGTAAEGGPVSYNVLTDKPTIPPAQTYLHEDLTDVSPDQHHPQLHDLDSHTDVTINPGILNHSGLWWDAVAAEWTNRASATESWPTGLVNGGELNIGPGVNDIEVIAGLGIVVDSYTTPIAPSALLGLEWDQINEPITIAPAVAGSVVWFSIYDTGVPTGEKAGDIVINVGGLHQYAQSQSPTLGRQEIFLGVAVHNGVTWNEISNPKVINQGVETLRELLVTVLPLSHIISGGTVSEAATFTLDQIEGVIWENNRNWHVDKSDPNRETLPAASPIMFQYVNRDFTDVETLTPTVDPTRYDNGTGAPVAVGGPANNTTIQRLYLDPAGNYWMLWGQNIYQTWDDAAASLSSDNSKTVVPYILQNSILLGHVITERNQVDWSPVEAVWLPAGNLSAGIGGGGTPITDHGNLNGLENNDHPQYLPTVSLKPNTFTVDEADGMDHHYKVTASGVVVQIPDTLTIGHRFQVFCQADTTFVDI